MPKCGLQIEIKLVPDLGWHWRIFTGKKVDWSGTAESLDHAIFNARMKAKELLKDVDALRVRLAEKVKP